MKYQVYILLGVLSGMAFRYFQTPVRQPHRVLIVQSVEQKKVSPPALVSIPSCIDSIVPPPDYIIIRTAGNSFGKWLLHLPLRKNNTLYLYNGQPKLNQWLHYAILDVPYNRNPLQQCADAVMRLRAEYLYATKAEPTIRFYHQKNEYFTLPVTSSRTQLENFLNLVFNWCGTYSLQAQLHPVKDIQQVQAGDVFVKGGSPGHAMLVAAVAQNKQGHKVFLLLQSFIPAQDIHLVKNTFNEALSPWYNADAETIVTPGYTFQPQDLRRW